MKNTILYIAISLDGYIADVKGKVDWLKGDNSEPGSLGSYPEFIETIDTVILGYNTYHQIVTELSSTAWPYEDKKSYVITSRKEKNTDNIEFINEDFGGFIEKLKKGNGKDIWICGGAKLANSLIELDMIDCYHISIIPTILGDGIRLFEKHKKIKELKLYTTQTYNGIVDLIYKK